MRALPALASASSEEPFVDATRPRSPEASPDDAAEAPGAECTLSPSVSLITGADPLRRLRSAGILFSVHSVAHPSTLVFTRQRGSGISGLRTGARCVLPSQWCVVSVRLVSLRETAGALRISGLRWHDSSQAFRRFCVVQSQPTSLVAGAARVA